MSFILGLLFGGGLGAFGYHYFQYYRANNVYSEGIVTKKNKDMVLLFEDYPYLMNLIKSNVNDPEYKNVREFFVVDPLAIMNSSVTRLRYDLSEETLSLLTNLEKLGYVEQLEHDSLLYQMDEEFIEDLNAFNPSMLSEQEHYQQPAESHSAKSFGGF